MNRTLTVLSLLILIPFSTASFLGCKNEEIPSVWNPDATGGSTPTVGSVTPASALGNITHVTLTGSGFAPVDSDNAVYFGTTAATIVSASSTSLTVIPPDLDNGAYQIKVVVAGAFSIATFGPYTVEHAGVEYGGFQNLDETYSIAVDGSERLFAQLKAVAGDTARVFTIAPVPPYNERVLFGTLKDASSRPWPKASDMRIGPGGYLYLQQTNNPNLYRIPPTGGVTELYLALPAKATGIDFDANGNLFAGGDRAGMSVVNPSGASRIVGSYATMTIKALRVYNGYLYAATATPGATPGVWRSQILNAAGDLGPAEQVFAWASAPGTFPSSAVLSLAIASDGTIYVGTDNVDPILTIPPGGPPEALYPGVLNPPATQLIWGTGQYLYCNRDNATAEKRRVIRIAMGKDGAPDYGRQ